MPPGKAIHLYDVLVSIWSLTFALNTEVYSKGILVCVTSKMRVINGSILILKDAWEGYHDWHVGRIVNSWIGLGF